jgi:hypothetical protein
MRSAVLNLHIRQAGMVTLEVMSLIMMLLAVFFIFARLFGF